MNNHSLTQNRFVNFDNLTITSRGNMCSDGF